VTNFSAYYHNGATFHEKRENFEDDWVTNHGHFDLNYNRIKEGKSNAISLPLNLRLGWRF